MSRKDIEDYTAGDPSPDLMSSIEDKQLWEELAPFIKKAMQFGGGAQQILSKSQGVAAVKLVELLLYSDKDDVKLRAAKELLDRSLGKSVERKISIHGDFNDMPERQLDAEITRLLESGDGGAVLDAIVESKAKSQKKEIIPAELKKSDK